MNFVMEYFEDRAEAEAIAGNSMSDIIDRLDKSSLPNSLSGLETRIRQMKTDAATQDLIAKVYRQLNGKEL